MGVESDDKGGCGSECLDEVIRALNKIAEGHRDVRMEAGGLDEPGERLKEAVSRVSAHLSLMVDMSHEFAMAMAESFDVLHRVRSGDLDARITYNSKYEILEYSRDLSNSTIGRLADEIATRRKAEGELKILAAAVEQTAEGIIITDGNSICQYANPAFVEMSGYTRSELLGKSMKEIDQVGDGSVESLRSMFETLADGNVWRGMVTSTRKDSTRFVTESTVSPLRNENGVIDRYVLVKRDVTVEHEIKKRLEQSQKLEALGTLSGGIAHELNNVLTPIIGYTELVLDDVEHMPQVRKNLQQILVASERAREILWKILSFSRSEQAEALGRSGVHLGEVVSQTMDLFAATIPQTIAVEFESHLGDDDLTLIGATHLQQILLNLAMNSVAAFTNRQGKIKITIRDPGQETLSKFMQDSPAAHYIEMQVEDNGQGIAPEQLERIFEPFYTTKPVGQGTGLGLSVVHGIVRNQGGFINVKSTMGEGTSFYVYLPRFVDGGPFPEPATEARLDIHGGRECILLVDDEETVVNVFKLQLEGLGYEVEAFTQPTSALAAFMRNPQRYDLLLCDHSMPMMTGVVLAAEARIVRPLLPVIICTGFANAMSSDELVELGEVEVLDKPVMVRELAKTVRKLLDKN